MIIVEFNGLPGSGKSTICTRLNHLCEKYNVPCLMFNTDDKKMRMYNRIRDTLILLKPHNIKFMFIFIIKLLHHLHRKNFAISLGWIYEMKMIRRQCVLFAKYHSLNRVLNGIILCDQGIIQDFTALIRSFEFDDSIIEWLASSYFDLMNSMIMVECNIKVNESLNRIQKRNRKICEFDYLDEQYVKRILLKDNENIMKLRAEFCKYIRTIPIDSMNDSLENGVYIFKQLALENVDFSYEKNKNEWNY